MTRELLLEALSYANKGFKVFPLTPFSKIPLKGTQGSKEATQDETTIKKWWTANPDANIGLVTSNFFVLDVDVSEEADGFKSLEVLKDNLGDLPDTYSVNTVNNGLHLYFRKPKLIELPQKIGLVKGIDIKAHNNNYVVAPGSKVKGADGQIKEYHLNNKAKIAEAPTWLLDLILKDEPKKPIVSPEINSNRYRSKTTILLESLVTGAEEGARNDTIAKITGSLLAYGVTPSLAYQLVIFANSNFKPPLDDIEVNKTFLSIAKKEVGVSEHRK